MRVHSGSRVSSVTDRRILFFLTESVWPSSAKQQITLLTMTKIRNRNAMPASVGWLAYQPDGRPLNLITIMGHTAQANVLSYRHMSLLSFQLVRPTLHPAEASSADGVGADNDNYC
jgi:hypothetical protein